MIVGREIVHEEHLTQREFLTNLQIRALFSISIPAIGSSRTRTEQSETRAIAEKFINHVQIETSLDQIKKRPSQIFLPYPNRAKAFNFAYSLLH